MNNTNTSDANSSNTKSSILDSDDNVAVTRGKLSKFILYEISKEELERLKQGSGTTELNFAFSMLTMVITLAGSLLTADFKFKHVSSFFGAMIFMSLVMGIYFLISWYRKKQSLKELVKEIESRINGNGTQN